MPKTIDAEAGEPSGATAAKADGGWVVAEPDDGPEFSEAEDEFGQAEEDQEKEDEDAGEETEKAPPAEAEWDGDPASLPPQLQKVHKEMVRGVNAKFQELARMRHDYEQKLEELAKAPVRANAEIAEPQIDTSTPESLRASLNKIVAFSVEQALKGKVAPVEESNRAVMAAMTEMQRDRMWSDVRADKGFSPEVEKRMVELATNDPFWHNQPSTADALMALYKFARRDLAEIRVVEDDKQHKATAAQRAVSRAGVGTRKASAANNYAEYLGRPTKDALEAMWKDAKGGV